MITTDIRQKGKNCSVAILRKLFVIVFNNSNPVKLVCRTLGPTLSEEKLLFYFIFLAGTQKKPFLCKQILVLSRWLFWVCSHQANSVFLQFFFFFQHVMYFGFDAWHLLFDKLSSHPHFQVFEKKIVLCKLFKFFKILVFCLLRFISDCVLVICIDINILFWIQGWSSSADPRRRAGAIKHIEAEDMKKEMNEVQMRKYAEYDDIRSSVSLKFCLS